MVKVLYKGAFGVCRITANGSIFDKWPRFEVRDVDETTAQILLDTGDFALLSKDEAPKKKEVNLDLDNDGDIDKEDKSIAAKVLATGKRKKVV